MPPTQTLTYTPLDRSTQSIRLIEILPGDGPQISCKLHVYRLDEFATCPPFTALSYTWGQPDPASEVAITVDGQIFLARKNLWEALSSYRKKSEGKFPSLIWIDALSINQQDNLERNHQVNMMKAIFSRATTVLVWLGPEEDDSSRLIQFLVTRAPSLVYHGPLELRCVPKFARDDRGYAPKPEFTIEDLFQELFELQLLQAFEALFKRDYWKRLWIVQEIMLAENLVVLCGDQSCSWRTLVCVTKELKNLGQIVGPNLLPIVRPPEGQLRVLERKRLQAQIMTSSACQILRKWADANSSFLEHPKRAEGLDFRELIQTWLHQECADPRDKVYGLLGLAKGTEITADYDKPIDELYCDVIASVGPGLDTVFVSALTRAIYKDPSEEKIKHLSLITGIDVENVLSYFMDFLVMPPWPDEEEHTAEPPVTSSMDSETGELHDHQN